VSIIEIGDGVIEVLSTNGDTRLGGDDFDNRVTQWLIDEFKKAEGVDLSSDKMALQRLKEAAEKAKKELSTATTTNINLPFITATPEGPKHLDMSLSRAKFDELTHDLIERTAIPVQNALKDAGITSSELGHNISKYISFSICIIFIKNYCVNKFYLWKKYLTFFISSCIYFMCFISV